MIPFDRQNNVTTLCRFWHNLESTQDS